MADTQRSNRVVDLWTLALEADSVLAESLFATLSDDERVRANRFATTKLRTRYVVGRAALRALLGLYLDRAPASVPFEYGKVGKPRLPDAALQFNVSHSEGLAVFAFTADRELGVDVEELRPVLQLAGVARRFFAPGEQAELAAVEESQQSEAFLNCWTRKEAYLKAIGDGLSAPLDRFEVTLRPGDPARFRHIDGDSTAAARWQIHHFGPIPGFVGALVALADAEPQPFRTIETAQALLVPSRLRSLREQQLTF